MPKTVIINIPLDGLSTGASKLKMETTGFTGAECQDATKAFESAIGTQSDEELTGEFFDTGENHERITGG
jgi:hypothetical protein